MNIVTDVCYQYTESDDKSMIKRYGKEVDMRTINRDLDQIKETAKNARKRMDIYTKFGKQRDKCPMCGSMEARKFLKVYDKYQYLQCKNCGGLYLEEYPNIEEMYSSNDMVALTTEYIDNDIFYKRLNMISKPKVDFVMDICKENGLSIKFWLDVGCGGGEIPYYLIHELGIKAEGIETNPLEIQFARDKGITVYEKYVDIHETDQEINAIINRQDCVSIINMLEHVEEPAELIAFLHQKMEKDTVLVFEVPKHPALASFANMTSKDNIYRHITPPVHLQIFSIDAIQIMLENKFEVLATWEFGQGFNDLLHNAMILSEQDENQLYIDLQRCSNKIQKAIDECGYGDQIVVVAKKK
ncbi:MAG: class I SAM-dependent methyltransferase [Lachnospiraceae bacterium]|nr:class I SAM-dependent methyltransferase [Lachnospiraceae bacterium]MDY5521445.1 class I SAM-dependent methyltransferase [Agathobacter sp.]